MSGPESDVLPLHHSPIALVCGCKDTNISGIQNKSILFFAKFLNYVIPNRSFIPKKHKNNVITFLYPIIHRIFVKNFTIISRNKEETFFVIDQKEHELLISIERMNDTKILIEKIKEGIQEKKGKNIVVADLTNIDDTICKYFVICQGNSPSQVSAIVDSIKDFARKDANSKPIAIDGLRNAEWVAMDFADVLVHIFLPETRAFYNLEHLWADAKLTQIPDLD